MTMRNNKIFGDFAIRGRELLRFILSSGRMSITPMTIANRDEFIRYLDRYCARKENVREVLNPSFMLRSPKRIVYFESEDMLVVKYFPRKLISLRNRKSSVYFSGQITIVDGEYCLKGSFKYPRYMEWVRYFIFLMFGYYLLYGVFRIVLRLFKGDFVGVGGADSTLYADVVVLVFSIPFCYWLHLTVSNVNSYRFLHRSIEEIELVFSRARKATEKL